MCTRARGQGTRSVGARGFGRMACRDWLHVHGFVPSAGAASRPELYRAAQPAAYGEQVVVLVNKRAAGRGR